MLNHLPTYEYKKENNELLCQYVLKKQCLEKGIPKYARIYVQNKSPAAKYTGNENSKSHKSLD